ncbi:MAG: EAL domain-containing protein [Campylobacterales bacterium]|nr:EAL domain-containing protein [Campylobacterales bacterium]
MSFNLDDLQEHNSQLLKLLTQNLPDMLWVKDIDGTYLYANQAICDGLLMAQNTQEPIGKNDIFFALRERQKHKDNPNWHTFGELCFNSDQVVIDNNKAMKFEEYGNVKGQMLYLEVYKAPFYDENGTIIGTVGAGRDITELKKIQLNLKESLQQLEEQRKILEFQANFDFLTKLPNRVFFINALQQCIDGASTADNNVAILFIDIDHFKEINDSLGHYIGDQLLVAFAKRLKTKIREGDTVARFGGDEFCILLRNITQKEEIAAFIEDTMEILQTPFDIESNLLYIGMSIGISMSCNNQSTSTELLKHADAAMYEAKANGRNTYSYYDKEMTIKATKRISLETALHEALQNEDFEPYFQPQVNSRRSKIVGMEVLMRWIGKNGEIITPDKFLAYTEDTGMIILLDRLVIEKALKSFLFWREKGLFDGSISFNLSTRQLEDNAFLDFVQKHITPILERYPNSIEFEVTETQIMINQTKAIKTLQELEKFGIKISIDDFGTGYSSLSYLKKLPISKLKIDRSFIEALPHDQEDVVISKTIISLAKTLNLNVIAEGAQTKEQIDFLLENGCDTIQGYYYSKALNKTQMEEFLKFYLLKQ